MCSAAKSRMTLSTSLRELRVERARGLVEEQDVGVEASARAMATRCCMPPESSQGTMFSLPSRPIFTNSSLAWAMTWSLGRFCTDSGASVMFFSTVCGWNRLKFWNTRPKRVFRLRARPCRRIRNRSRCRSPRQGRAVGQAAAVRVSSSVMQRKSVDLPPPEGADDGDDLALLHRQGDIFEHLGLAEALTCVRKRETRG